MSLPVSVNADTVNPSRGAVLIDIGDCLYSCKARIPAFQNGLADYMRAHIHHRSKLCGCSLRVFYRSRLGKNGLDLITCRKHPAPTIENHTALRLSAPVCPLLFEANVSIVAALEKLKVKTPRAQRQKGPYQK
jgi:hypothetical protein